MQGENIIPESIKDCIAARLQGNITTEQEAVFCDWLESSERNKRFFEQLEMIWKAAVSSPLQQFDVEKAWREVEERIDNESESQPQHKKYRQHTYHRLKPFLKIAAMLVVAYALGMVTVWRTGKLSGSSSQYVEMTAPKGSRAFLTLDDGTKVWLNAGTSLKYPKDYGQRLRNVCLNGEAYFEVAKNKNIPFVVNANGVNITALGTAFNVKAYADDGNVETTLTEGSVQVEPADGQTNMRPIILQPNQKVVLKAGAVQLAPETPQIVSGKPINEIKPTTNKKEDEQIIDIVELSDTRPYTSWKDSRWVFKQQDLEELAIKLERRYDVQIVFTDEHLKDYVVSGTLLDETLEQVMNTLRLTAPIDYTIDHKMVILKENPELKKKYQQLIR